jgi:hypothetical protein
MKSRRVHLAEERKRLNITYRELGEAIGRGTSTVHSVLNGTKTDVAMNREHLFDLIENVFKKAEER